jgi:hypothetical protein
MNDVKDSVEFYRNLWANAESRLADCESSLMQSRAEVERLRVNAERYEWLRDECDDERTPAYAWILQAPGDTWDAAIDAARGVKP